MSLGRELALRAIVEREDQTARESEIRLFSHNPPPKTHSQTDICGSQDWGNYTRQLIISQLASIMARDPGLVLKNPKSESSQFNDPRISSGFTGSWFPPRPMDKSPLPASRGGIEFVKKRGTMVEGNENATNLGKKAK